MRYIVFCFSISRALLGGALTEVSAFQYNLKAVTFNGYTTRSPTLMSVTSIPIFSTIPEASVPRPEGNAATG